MKPFPAQVAFGHGLHHCSSKVRKTQATLYRPFPKHELLARKGAHGSHTSPACCAANLETSTPHAAFLRVLPRLAKAGKLFLRGRKVYSHGLSSPNVAKGRSCACMTSAAVPCQLAVVSVDVFRRELSIPFSTMCRERSFISPCQNGVQLSPSQTHQ